MVDSYKGHISHKTHAGSRLLLRIRVLFSMGLFHPQEPKRLTALVATAFLLTFFAVPASLRAQQLIASESTGSSSSLPDAPSTLLGQQSGQTATPAPAPQSPTSNDPDAANPNGPQQTKRILGIMPN